MKFADLIRKNREIEVPDNEYYWDVANATTMGRYLTKTEYMFIDQCLRKNHFIQNILDVGGGSGRFAVPLYERGFNVVVLEKDLLPLHKLNKRKSEISTIFGDGTHLPFNESTFDCILCIEISALVVHRGEQFFDECFRVLRKNGILIFTMGNRNSWVPIAQKLLLGIEHRDYIYKKSLRDIKTELVRKGFKVELLRGFRWIPGGRVSNNKFIPLFQFSEKIFGLRFLKEISPQLLIMGRRK